MKEENKIKNDNAFFETLRKNREYRTQIQELILDATSCDVQYDGWTCGTCFFDMDKTLTNPEWQTLLYFRGDNKKEDLHNLPNNLLKSFKKIINIARKKI